MQTVRIRKVLVRFVLSLSAMASQRNLADAIYQVYKEKKKLSLRCQDLCALFPGDLHISDLKALPFIKLTYDNMARLVVELDNCCKGCKYKHCKLLVRSPRELSVFECHVVCL